MLKLLVNPCVALAATAAIGVAGAVDVAAHPDPLPALTCPDPKLAANKRLVFDLWREGVETGHGQLAGRHVAADFIEHNPNAAPGLAGFIAYPPARTYTTTRFNMFRTCRGKCS